MTRAHWFWIFIATLTIVANQTIGFAQENSSPSGSSRGTTDPHAQAFDVPTVSSDGIGTVVAVPSHVAFWLRIPLPEGNLKESLPAAVTIESELREYFSERELHPVTMDVYPPSIDSLEEGRSHVAVELRFSMAGLVGGELGAAKFGELCAVVNSLGKKMLCRVSGPELVVAERSITIQEAVREATAQAFTAASGAASALNMTIRSVNRINIVSVEWNNPPDTQGAYPNIELIACTAKVGVVYTLE